MSKTLLQMVNDVYTNLREDTIVSFTTDYDNLIVNFINQAKEIVEDAWQWHVLRQQITWTSVASQAAYDLTATTASTGDADVGSNVWLLGRTQIYNDPFGRIDGWDTTVAAAPQRLQQVPYWYGREQAMANASRTQAQPYQLYISAGVVNLVAAPTASARTYTLTVVTPQDVLTATTDELLIPWRPVVTLATAWAVNERGEELGNRPILPQSVLNTDWASQAEKDLARAIALDSSYDESELVMDAGQITWQG